MYFMIENKDGDTLVTLYNKAEIEKLLAEESHEFLAAVPTMDTNYWHGKALLIKGDIVLPKAVQVVTAFEVP